MEDHHSFFFSSETPLMGSMSNDHLDHNNFDPIAGSFDQGFDDFVFGNVFASGVGLPFDAVVGSPDINFSLDGDAPACEVEEDHEQNYGEGNTSSGTTVKPRRDRSKTLVSERKRRGRMKEKLYELRSLVPNITKMDKASIIADAVGYVQSLQNQAKRLGEEITILESSLNDEQVFRIALENLKATQVEECNDNLCGAKIIEVMAHEVGEQRFYVKVECNKGDRVASSLYSAIESLEHFQMESSNLSFTSDRFVLTLTLNVRGFGEVMSASSMKLWVMGALLKEGFGFEVPRIQ